MTHSNLKLLTHGGGASGVMHAVAPQSTGFAPTTFISQGHLRATPFDELLRLALLSGAYGRLDLQQSNKKRRQIMFLSGLPVSVRSNVASETLPGFLLERQYIDKEEYQSCLTEHTQTRAMKGYLLSKGLITEEELSHAEAELAEQILQSCLSWTKARFRFKPIRLGSTPRQRLHLNPIFILARWYGNQNQPIRLSDSLETRGNLRLTPIGVRHQTLLDDCRSQVPGFARALDDWRSIDSLSGYGYDDPVARYLKAGIELGFVDVEQPGAEGQRGAHMRYLLNMECARLRAASSATAVLEVPPDATAAEIQSAYRTLDQFYRLKNFQDLADDRRVLERLNKAQKVIEGAMRSLTPEPPASRPVTRSSYMSTGVPALRSMVVRTSGLWEPPPKNPDTQQSLAHIFYLDGMTYMKIGDVEEALDHFQQAHQRYPQEARYLASLGWALYVNSGEDIEGREQGRQASLEAMHQDPDLDLTYVVLGNMYSNEGNANRAIGFYRKALDLNPRNKDARRRLRRLEKNA